MLHTFIQTLNQNVASEGTFGMIVMAINSQEMLQSKSKSQFHNDLLHSFNPFSNKPGFLCVFRTSLLKTLQEKEKLFVTSNSPFPTVFSTCLENLMPFSSNVKLSSAKSFSLEESKICRLGKG